MRITLLVLALLVAAFGASTVGAASLVVNVYNQDLVDTNPGNCICDTLIGGCTLHAARGDHGGQRLRDGGHHPHRQ
jgi:hypothetical protein